MPMSRVVSELLAEWHAEARDNDAEVYERARAASDAKRKLRREEEGREKEEKEEEQGVPEGWEEKSARSSGDKYWVHLTTGRYSWERPVDSSSERDSDGTEGKEKEKEGAVPLLWHEAGLAPDECVWDSEVDSEVPEILALEQKTAKARAANLQKREREAAAAAAAGTVLTTGGSKTEDGAAAAAEGGTGVGSPEAHAKPTTSGSRNVARYSGGGIAVGGLIRRKRQLTMDKRFGALSDTNHHRFWPFLNRGFPTRGVPSLSLSGQIIIIIIACPSDLRKTVFVLKESVSFFLFCKTNTGGFGIDLDNDGRLVNFPPAKSIPKRNTSGQGQGQKQGQKQEYLLRGICIYVNIYTFDASESLNLPLHLDRFITRLIAAPQQVRVGKVTRRGTGLHSRCGKRLFLSHLRRL